MPENAREGACRSWVSLRCRRAIGIGAVARDHVPRLDEELLHGFFLNAAFDFDRMIGFEHEIREHFEAARVALLGQLGDIFSDELWVILAAHDAKARIADSFDPGKAAIDTVLACFFQLGALIGVAELGFDVEIRIEAHLCVPPRIPREHENVRKREPSGGCVVRVLIGNDILPAGSRRVDDRNHLVDEPRIMEANFFDVAELGADAGALANRDGFFVRGNPRMNGISDMGVVNAGERFHFESERYDFLGIAEESGLVHEARRQAERAELHAFFHQRFHFRELFIRRRAPLVVLHDLKAHAVVTDVERHVRSDAVIFEVGDEISYLVRRMGAVRASDDGGDPLTDEAFVEARGAVRDENIRVVVDIDEAGSDDETRRVYDLRRVDRDSGLDQDHTAVFDAHIADAAGSPGAVDQVAALNPNVELLGASAGQARAERAEHSNTFPHRSHHHSSTSRARGLPGPRGGPGRSPLRSLRSMLHLN